MKHLLNIPTKWGLGLLAIMLVLPEAAAEETLGALVSYTHLTLPPNREV